MTSAEEQFDNVTLERQLGQRLHAFSNMVSGMYYQRTEVPFGVSLSEWRVLQETIASPGTSQGEVAHEHGLNVMNVSRAVSGLVRKRLIEAEADPTDLRRRLLQPTDLGIQMGVDIAKRATLMYGHIFADLSSYEVEQLDALMARVIDVLRAGDLPELPESSQPWADLLD